jgi:(1->4)-alpha-D-glucan 1-alpha-D-glucosylmutase
LTQALLRCAMPGTPDLYQGCEFWDFSLVDPDNRSEVDYRKRAASLSTQPPATLFSNWRDGRVKQAVIAATLAARRAMPALFGGGSYERLTVAGPRAGSVVAFVRRQDDSAVIAVGARLCGRELFGKNAPLPDADYWRDTTLELPESLAKLAAFSSLEGSEFALADRLPIAHILGAMPVALLILSPKK